LCGFTTTLETILAGIFEKIQSLFAKGLMNLSKDFLAAYFALRNAPPKLVQ
jgi:hypothetical protein